jgi:hypothetical protein
MSRIGSLILSGFKFLSLILVLQLEDVIFRPQFFSLSQSFVPCAKVREVVVIDDEPNFFREVQEYLVFALKELSFPTSLLSRDAAFGFGQANDLSFAPCRNTSVVCFWLTPCAQSRQSPGSFTWDIPANPVLVNLEVLSRSSSRVENEWELLCVNDPMISNLVWHSGPALDYLHENVDFLGPKGLGLSPNVQYLRLRYYPGIAYNDTSPLTLRGQKTIDVLFIGAPSPRRNGIIDELRKISNIRIEIVNRHLWGRPREEIVRQSRIVINLHYYEKNFETVRLFWLLSLGAFVIAEADPEINSRVMEEYDGSMIFSKYGSFVETVKKYLDPQMENERLRIAMDGYNFIRSEKPGEVLRPLLESAWGCKF